MIQWLTAEDADKLNRGKIVAMCEHKGRLFVATEHRVYEKTEGGELRALVFVNSTEGIADD